MALVLALLSSCTIMSDSIKPSKNLITRNYKVKDFSKIEAGTVGDIYYTQSADSNISVQIYGPDNIVELIKVSVKDQTLLLEMEKTNKIRNSSKLKIMISSPELDLIAFKGVGDVHIKNGLNTGKLEIDSKGVGDINIQSLTCEDLHIDSKGVGDVKIQGTAKNVYLDSKGVGDIDAGDLKAENVNADSKGVGDITCHAVRSISASSKGVGSIKYKGSPEIKELSKKGIGSIKNI